MQGCVLGLAGTLQLVHFPTKFVALVLSEVAYKRIFRRIEDMMFVGSLGVVVLLEQRTQFDDPLMCSGKHLVFVRFFFLGQTVRVFVFLVLCFPVFCSLRPLLVGDTNWCDQIHHTNW